MYRTAVPSQVSLAAPIYHELLADVGHPEVHRAEMELGNFVLDGTYRLGEDAASRRLELDWARSIAQELLGQVEYNIALDYMFGREGIPPSTGMWARYCARAAAYNIDLAQQFLSEGMLKGTVPSASIPEAYAWLRLASEKQTALRQQVTIWEAHMDPASRSKAENAVKDLREARGRFGAYYREGDPLRLVGFNLDSAHPEADPDTALRAAFELGKSEKPGAFEAALRLYREVRDRRDYHSFLKLSRELEQGSSDIKRNPGSAHRWLVRAAATGSVEAKTAPSSTH